MSAPAGEARTEEIPTAGPHSLPARLIRTFALPIIIGWVVIVALLNTLIPQLEVVGKMRAVSMSPNDAPSMIAIKEVGRTFEEYTTSSSVMVVLEGEEPLGPDAHAFYDTMVAELRADTEHVQHVQDFWGDTLTAKGAQSRDGKAAYVQVYIAGDQGETLANDSVDAVRKIATETPAPDGVKAYVTGPAASSSDQNHVGDKSMETIEAVTFLVIIVMLLMVYRSFITTGIVLTLVVLSLSGARGLIALLGYNNLFGMTTFATNMLVTLAIAAATDYGIFFIGRYQ